MEEKLKKNLKRRIDELRKIGIVISDELTPESKIRGIYGFFAKTKSDEFCFYIGKATDIVARLIGKNSHLNNYLRGVRNTYVLQDVEKYLTSGFSIEIKVLQEVKFIGDSFEKDANRLALAELQELVYYQNKGECDNQLSEAVKEKYERKTWNRIFSTTK